jgi:sortase A
LLLLAIAAFGYCAWTRIDADVYQGVQGGRLEVLLRGALGSRKQLAAGGIAAVTRGEAEASGLIGRVEIPRLRIFAVIAEGTGSGVLRRAVGHVPGTAFPGESGNVVLAGHRDSYFSDLGGIRSGDLVRLSTPDGEFDYRVDSARIVGDGQTEVLAPTDSPTLTLITCFPFHYLGPAPRRFVVRASPTHRHA